MRPEIPVVAIPAATAVAAIDRSLPGSTEGSQAMCEDACAIALPRRRSEHKPRKSTARRAEFPT
jgi:hypothetical protein